MSDASWMIYGANGYTGELAAREAVRRGLAPVLAGRNTEAVAALAAELGLAHRAFPLDDEEALRAGVDGMAAVLHCAGPFVRTSRRMVDACLAARAHYLDITGEISVFERVLSRGDEAPQGGRRPAPWRRLRRGAERLPGGAARRRPAGRDRAGPGLHLRRRHDQRGTLKTMIESFPHAGAVRRNGEIVPVPLAWDAREIEFAPGQKKRWAMTIPWGDVSTAYHSTGIPNIRVYTGTPPKRIRQLRRWSRLLPLLGFKPVKRFLQRQVERRVTGPSPEVRETARVALWGEVRNAAGKTVTGHLETPEGYQLTAVSAVESAVRAVAGRVEPGAWTPSQAFGARYVNELPGVKGGV